MNSQVLGLRVASVLFGLMSIAQLVRLVLGLEVVVAGRRFPLRPSGLTFLFLGGLSIWMCKLARAQKR